MSLTTPTAQFPVLPQAQHHRLVPLLEELIVCRWEAHQAHDQFAGHDGAELAHEVESVGVETSHDRRHDVVEQLLIALEAGRGENRSDDLAERDVGCAVHLQQVRAEHGAERLAVETVREPIGVGEPGDHELLPS